LHDNELPVAYDLLWLTADQRKREQGLLRKLRKQWPRDSCRLYILGAAGAKDFILGEFTE